MPYVHTTLLIDELVKLQHEESGGRVRIYERAGMRKDRYSSLSYNYYVALQIENKMNRNKVTDFDSNNFSCSKRRRLNRKRGDTCMGKSKRSVSGDFDGAIGISERFAVLNRLITRDLNNNTNTPTFSLYTKDNITEYLSNPYTYERQLRRAVTYIYGASSHFRRLIQYFTGLSDLSFVVSPYRIDPKTANVKSVNRNYRKVLNAMSAMNVRSQFPKILTVCLREDTFYGTMWVTNDNITIQQLPSDYCAISTIEGNVLNVTFDFSYFDAHSQYFGVLPCRVSKQVQDISKQPKTKMARA